MKITEVTISRTLNLGDYNSLKVELKAEINGDDHPPTYVADELHKEINQIILRSGNVPTYKKARLILGDRERFGENQIKWAEEYIENHQ